MSQSRPQSITRIAADHGLLRAQVKTLIVEHEIATYRLATATVVEPAYWPRLRPVLERYCENKCRREGVALAS